MNACLMYRKKTLETIEMEKHPSVAPELSPRKKRKDPKRFNGIINHAQISSHRLHTDAYSLRPKKKIKGCASKFMLMT